MSAIKTLLDSLLWDIYGEQRQQPQSRDFKDKRLKIMSASVMGIQRDVNALTKLDLCKLIDVCAILKVEIRLMSYLLERVLIARDRNHRIQDVLCGFVDAIIHVEYHDVHPKMRFSLSPPSPKVIFSTNVTEGLRCGSESPTNPLSQHHYQDNNNSINCYQYNMQRQEDNSNSNTNQSNDQDTTSDYKQWLHAMKLVARLPGGIPPEFRRKLWLLLADKYLKSKNVDWDKEEEKCFCEKWREDDEELGIQIVKDLHRTGSTLCTGPAGDVNQAKLKRILLGYARYNPEVGYCQGFNMLGALILQVMDKEEAESIKVMIYLVEGILPTGYFCGSMGGLQADMAVFRELMQTKLPRLAKHLQKLQGPMENAFEPPLTNVFTMQWFLTMFCTCLPMSCVLRVWDLVLIEGSDVLLRTALALWSLLEERVLSTRSADDFYGKMGSFSSELLNGHLIDSNGLIEKVVQLGPISDIQQLRDKHLYNIAPLRNQQGIHLYYDDDEPDIDEDSRLAVATVWGIPWGRRGSQGSQATNNAPKQTTENKDRIALDISLLKKQYDRLRERQKQAHIILTTACSSARQGTISNTSNAPLPVNQLLSGRPAIVTNRGRRSGPPAGAIPPARKPSLPAVLHDKPLEKHLRRGETLHWQDTTRRDSLSWKEIKAERKAMITSGSVDGFKSSQKLRNRRLGKSDSSSYSEESDEIDEVDGSSSDTSFCDDENQPSLEMPNKQKTSSKIAQKYKKRHIKERNLSANIKENVERERPKSWAPSYSDIPFVLMTIDSPTRSSDENPLNDSLIEVEKNATENVKIHFEDDLSWKDTIHSPIGGDLAISQSEILATDTVEVINKNLVLGNRKLTDITTKTHLTESTNSLGSGGGEEDETKTFDVSDEGVTNEYFERVNSTDRPTKLDLLFSLNEEEIIRDAYKDDSELKKYESQKHDETLKNSRCMDLLVDYSEKSSAACIAEAKSEISTTLHTVDTNAGHSLRKDLTLSTEEFVVKRLTSAEKRRNPRRLTLTRSSTMDIEKRYQALEKRLSMEVSTIHKPFIEDNGNAFNEKQRFPKEKQITCDESRRIGGEDKDNHESEVNDNQLDTKRKIPSTADLEERFKNMKLHLVSERSDKITSASDSESPGKQKNGEHGPREQKTTEKSKEKNLNTKKDEQTDKAEDLDLDTKETKEEKRKITESDSDSQIKTSKSNNNKESKESDIETESDSKSTSNKTNITTSKKKPPDIKGNDSMETNNENKSSIDGSIPVTEKTSNQTKKDKVPSGKEENIQKDEIKNEDQSKENSKEKTKLNETSLDKGKENTEIDETQEKQEIINKKPPEMNNETKETKIEETKDSNDKNSKREKHSVQEKQENINKKTQEINNENKETEMEETKDSKEKHLVQEKQENINKKTQEMNNATKETKMAETKDSTDKNSSKEKNVNQRKSPPSTEELERRFSALEKQMSITKNESNDLNKSIEDEQEVCNENSSSEKIKESIDKTSPKSTEAQDNIEKSVKDINEESKTKKLSTSSTQRRLSEPPSTEELEKRYEVVKRRMSSRQFDSKTFTKEETFIPSKGKDNDLAKPPKNSNSKASPTSTKANDDQEHIKHSPKETLDNKQPEEVPITTDKDFSSSTTKQSPPSTENLEKRFAKLQNSSHLSTKENSPNKHSPPSMENLEMRFNELQDNTKNQSTKQRLSSNETQETKEKLIKEVEIKNPALDKGSRQKRSALMEELQSKIKANASGEQVKPSSINPSRRPISQNILLASRSFNDETSETHATYAYSISGKYEPGSSSNRKMVRRFSDLPSRADLENRLQFLEERLSKTLSKQRRASDSEVSSKHHRFKQSNKPPLEGSLEYRVQELEKYLKETRTVSMDVECTQTPAKHTQDPEIEISQIELAANSVDVTGKELVRYSQFGEVTEFNHQNPINISINIQMTLPKDDNENKKMNDLPKADELDKRLQILEQQLKTTQPSLNDNSQVPKSELKSSEILKDGNENQADSSQTNKIICESKVNAAEKSIENHDNSKKNHDVVTEKNVQKTWEKESDIRDSTVIADSHITDGENERKEKETESKVNADSHIANEKNKIKEKESDNSTVSHVVDRRNARKEQDCETNDSIADSHIDDGAKIQEKECKEKQESIKQPINEPVTTEDTSSKVKKTKGENEEKQPTKDNSKSNDNKNKDQSEPHNQHDIETKTIEEPLPKEKQKLEVNESEVLPKTQNKKTTTSTNREDPESNTIGNQVQNETPSKLIQNNEVKATELTDNIESSEKENMKEIISQAICQKNDNTEAISQNFGTSQMVPIEVNKKTLVLLLDNEPKSVKVRRLTRANTEELEDLFQALEKQLNERSQDKSDEAPLQFNEKFQKFKQTETELTQAMEDLTKEIQEFSKTEKPANETVQKKQPSPSPKKQLSPKKQPSPKKQSTPKKPEEEFDWGIDPNKYHLKKKTVYLPSTKELEARFRSLERQIKLLEDVEKIDVEQRLIEIERKIKLQYSLSHEKDLNKFLELCEGKMVDEISPSLEKQHDCSCNLSSEQRPYKNSPKHTSPKRLGEAKSPSINDQQPRYRAVDQKRSMSKQQVAKKEPIHPLEMLLDPSPDDSKIPTTGELEHRMRMLEDPRYTPSPPSRKSRSQSPPRQNKPMSNIERHYDFPTSPTERGLPTAEELEARLEALEKTQRFDFKMQKNFQHFNQKLKDVISPSLSFEEIDSKTKSRPTTPKSVANKITDAVSPKTIRFRDEVPSQIMHRSADDHSMVSTNKNVIQILEENSKMIQRILKKTIADTHTLGRQQSTAVQEGLGVMGIRLMRETSPLQRKGTHTGVPLRTGENINDQLTSIKNTIKSINTLCEEKPYKKERCQQYIDALFSDSTYFATKKSSLEDLATRNTSRSTSRELGPSIRISGHSPAFTRSMGSADSIRSTSPSRQTTSPLQYRSNRDLRREPSPRRRRDEDREEHESRVRRDNLLPNNINCNHSTLSHSSHSLTKFHKVDSQLISNDIDVEHELALEERLRHPIVDSSIESKVTHDDDDDNNTNTSNTVNTTTKTTLINEVLTSDPLKSNMLDWPISPYRQTSLTNTKTPVYTPAKLEIRHTTVTSTFYDRVLTEKQLEKQHSVMANKSPMVSPLYERPCYQTSKSPPKLPYQESTNTMILSEASTGNYRMYQPNIHANNG